ncbi:MAG: prepilin-type N-terminal cleavage/methylation domain-containing protein [Phycisphaerales bacterium]|nr:prepilin-type N-terminal cleavage/methylation domain-containing protein [Phycisphaerales bacterium]
MATRPGQQRAADGFTLVELLATLVVVGLLFAIVLPNLGALVPAARLRGSGVRIRSELEWARSEARIQGKRMAAEFDLDRGIWRLVYPPEQRLTRDEDESTLVERPDDWVELEEDVGFAGAGDGKSGLAQKGLYRVAFDEYGFTGDQVLVLHLKSQPMRTWTLRIHGLSGRADTFESETGEKPLPPVLGEGAF